MVSMIPCSTPYDMRHMYNFSDTRNKTPNTPNQSNRDNYHPESLMDLIHTNADFTIFSKMIKKANYDIKLSEKQANFTLFVPSDNSLRKKYPPEFLDNIDKGLAIQILNYSMMVRTLDQELLQASPFGTYPTLARSNHLKITTTYGKTILKDTVNVIHFNHKATNGLIHVIDDFLIPEQTCY